MQVGFIGLGSQGGPMARRIVEAGHPTTLWARRVATCEPYAASSARIAGSLEDMAATCDLVCLCVTDDADVDEVISAERGLLSAMKPGSIIAIHSTVHPETCRRLAKLAEHKGVSVVDAPVSGGGPAAEAGRLLVMVGGEDAVVERCRPVFGSYANRIAHLGPLGAGQQTKLLNNLLFAANLGIAGAALQLGESFGLSRQRLAEVVSGGSAASFALNTIAAAGGSLDGLAAVAGQLLQKDVRLVSELAAGIGAELGTLCDAADAALTVMGHPR